MPDGFFTSAVIVAAGKGLRFDGGAGEPPKQFWALGGGTVLSECVSAFCRCPGVDEVVVVGPGDGDFDAPRFKAMAGLPGGVKAVGGGPRRVDSARLGFLAISPGAQVVLVHDAARPLVRPGDIGRVREAARLHGAAILAIPVSDTLKLAGPDGDVAKTVPRDRLWRAQTPQGFSREVLGRAFSLADGEGFTDEASMVEAMGVKVRLVLGSQDNLKITDRADLEMARAINEASSGDRAPGLRVGQGWDFHAFCPGRPLWLGCVLVPGETGLSGHSDADVLAHAFIDALLGAAGLGDIGSHFPPGDPRWLGAPGSGLIARAMDLFSRRGYRLVNADLTVIGERPRVSDYREAMIEALAGAAGVPTDLFNLKGKTTEGLGFIGRGEGLAATAVVLAARH
ncbi:MAG: 2-C-methyl-D-erythritol 4-phosphate cytidylyltransferase [Deltaproteobacteria bacterium]|nr:2-C-methyl-D-erythritol 4-phosphate cytidylyltransferase [Deltaproteobacteria bacterium]